MFSQTFEPYDLVLIGLLVVLEGVLSIDNALVLGLLAKRLPKAQQSRALTYGLVGAFIFRLLAIATATYLLRWRIVKLLGGGYLLYVALKHFFFDRGHEQDEKLTINAAGEPTLVDPQTGRELSSEECANEIAARAVPTALEPSQDSPRGASFWSTVFVIEMTDIAFAIDSILAAIALVGSARAGHEGAHPKLWVVLTGGMLGVILMRYAAVLFIKLLERFPRFEVAAYLLVIVIGLKLLLDWAFNSAEHPHRVDFHDFKSPAFWAFWVAMLVCFSIGFLRPKEKAPVAGAGPVA